MRNITHITDQPNEEKETKQESNPQQIVVECTHPTTVWNLGIEELEGFIIESKGREEVNQKLSEGWILLHVYTLKYKNEDIWMERPMAILGRPKKPL